MKPEIKLEVEKGKQEILECLHESKRKLEETYFNLLRDTNENMFPKAPEDPTARLVWYQLRDLAKSKEQLKRSVPFEDKKERKIIHHLAELFNFGHVMADDGKSVVVFKRENKNIQEPPQEEKSWDDDAKLFYTVLKKFFYSADVCYNFPSSLTGAQRAKVHKIAELFGFEHDTFGRTETKDRYVRVTKIDPAVREVERQRKELFTEAIKSRPNIKENEMTSPDDNYKTSALTPSRAGQVRCVQWNVAWMDLLLDDETLCSRVANVIKDLDGDIIAIQEGPASSDRMRMFVDKYLPGFLVFGALEELRQQLFFLVRKDGPVKDVKVFRPALKMLSQPWQFDTDGERILSYYKFTRRPLIIHGELFNGKDFFACTMHMKSKKVGSEIVNGLNDKVIAKAIKNRRRIGAESYRLRECIETTILDKYKDPYVVVMGDLNTGPGSGFFERYYLLFDACDVLLGSPFSKTKKLYSPMINGGFIDKRDLWSAMFKDFLDGGKVSSKFSS